MKLCKRCGHAIGPLEKECARKELHRRKHRSALAYRRRLEKRRHGRRARKAKA